VLRSPTPAASAAGPPALEVTLDDGGRFNKELALNLWRRATSRSGSAARDLFQQALRLDPGNPQMHNQLAWLLATGTPEIRDAGAAVSHARQAVAGDGKQHQYHNTLGASLYRLEHFDEAIVELNRSRELDSRGVATVYDQIFLALSHARLGHREDGVFSLRARRAESRLARKQPQTARPQRIGDILRRSPGFGAGPLNISQPTGSAIGQATTSQ